MNDHGLPSNFYPVLHPQQWPGRSRCAHRPLLPGDPRSPLLVGYAVMTEEANQTLTQEQLEALGLGIEEIESVAVENWVGSFADVAWLDLSPEGESNTVVGFRSDFDAFSGGVVSEGIRRGLHRMLGSDLIFLAVPDRFTIIAGSNILAIDSAAPGMYEDAVKTGWGPLCPCVFVSEKGSIVASGRAERYKDTW